MSMDLLGKAREDRAKFYREKADEEERLAAAASDPHLKESHLKMASQWRQMAADVMRERL